MSSPISPADIIAIAKFAYELYEGCRAAPSEFAAVGLEVIGMRSILGIIKLLIVDKKDSILYVRSKYAEEWRKELEGHGERCLESLMQLEKLLKKYKTMNLKDSFLWVVSGKDEIAEVQAQMASRTTQLNTFLGAVNLMGLGAVNTSVKRVEESINIKGVGLDRIEEALRRHPGDEKKAVKEVMGAVGRVANREDARLYKTIISEYAGEMKVSQQSERKGRSTTPGPPKQGAKGMLDVPGHEQRSKSAGTGREAIADKSPSRKKRSKKWTKKPPNVTLECWLVKKGHATERKEEKQNRGQEQLKEMAEKFKLSNRCLKESDSLVKNPDLDPRYRWYYVASRVEKETSIIAFGAAEQIMIIIKRQMTPQAQKAADEKERKEIAQKTAAAARIAKEKSAKAEKAKKQKKGEKINNEAARGTDSQKDSKEEAKNPKEEKSAAKAGSLVNGTHHIGNTKHEGNGHEKNSDSGKFDSKRSGTNNPKNGGHEKGNKKQEQGSENHDLKPSDFPKKERRKSNTSTVGKNEKHDLRSNESQKREWRKSDTSTAKNENHDLKPNEPQTKERRKSDTSIASKNENCDRKLNDPQKQEWSKRDAPSVGKNEGKQKKSKEDKARWKDHHEKKKAGE